MTSFWFKNDLVEEVEEKGLEEVEDMEEVEG